MNVNTLGTAQMDEAVDVLCDAFGDYPVMRFVIGQVDDSYAVRLRSLVALPGVGRKTANVILGNAFGKDEGFVVDTHVGRLARRLGFTRQTDPVKVEKDLNAIVPKIPRMESSGHR